MRPYSVRILPYVFILALIFSRMPAVAQMRQIYLDTDPDNAVYKISFYSPAEGYVAFEKNIGYSSDSGRTFSKINITTGNVNFGNYTDINVTFGFEINGIKAFDKNNLIVYGDYGLVPSILYSSNGGNSFTLVYHSQFSPLQLSTGIMDLVFPNDGDTGYAVDADRVLKTTNKGLTWTVALTSAGAHFNHIEAVDKDNLIVMNTDYNANGMRKTSDGGASWSYGNIPYVSNGKITYAYFLDANTGWLSLQDDAQKLYIYKTINGGTNWSLQNNPDVTTFRIDKMRFLDANTGFALVPPFKVYKTLNGGAVWEPLAADNTFTYLGYSNNDLFCLSANQLWAGGGHGFLEMSANGGGEPVPASYFVVDTSGVFATNTVHLNNYSRSGYQYRWYVNNVLVSTSYNASYTHAIASGTDTIQLINTTGGLSDTLTKYQQFFVPKLPAIASFSPRTGSTGTLVTIKGSNFSGVTGVSVGGKLAASFTVVSDAVVTAVLADGASGSVALIDVHGSYSLGGFTYFPPPSSPPPSVTAFTPLAGIPGTTVTITGSGFGATAGQNGVFFGTIPAVIQSASATSIVCRVPAGASFCNIGVLNKTTGLRGSSTASFQLIFADSMNFTPSSFTSAYDVQPHPFVPWVVGAKDIDGDGKPDVLTAGSYSANDSVSVYRNISSGATVSFAPKVNVGHTYMSSTVPMGVEDLDGDGLPDLAGPNDSTINIYRNASSPGKIKFDSLYSITIPRQTLQLAIADLDNDGKNDLAVAISTVVEGQNRIAVVRNTSVPGWLSFGAPQIITAGGWPGSIAAGDLDGDGRKDLVTFEDGGVSASRLTYYINTSVPGAISFGARASMDISGGNLNAKNLWMADFDGDGKLDVIISNEVNVAIFRNTSAQGAISFAAPVILPIANGSLVGGGASLANFTGSGRPDIIVGRRYERMFGFFRNTSRPGAISLDSQITWSYTGVNPFSIDAADFDGDGKTDLASVDAGDDRIMVARNTTGVPLDFKICTDNLLGNDMVSDVAGADYQWQMDTGGGFRNVTESANLSNATTNTLHFYKTPMSWNGYKFRCLVHGLYSSTFVLRMTETIHPSLTLTGTDSIICYGKPVTFTATYTDTTGKFYVSGYEWQINGKDTGYSFFNTITSSTLHDKDQVRYLLDYYDVCNTFHADSSRVITMQVNETKSSVQVSASDTAVCAGVPVTFTANAINGGPAPTYIWKVNDYVQDGVTGPVFTSSWLPNGARVQVVLNSSLSCAPPAYSNLINMTVKDTSTISVGIKASTDSICEGINVVFTATPGEYMSSSAFEWQVNGTTAGSNTSTFSSTALHDKDKVQCILHVQGVCAGDVSAASNTVEMKVRSMVVPSVDLAIPADDCSGYPPIFTAQPVNGGDNPRYGWTWQGYTVWMNTSASYYRGDLTNGDVVTVSMISSAACAHPDTVSKSLTAFWKIPAYVLISVDTNASTGDTVTKLIITNIIRGGQGITYQWQDSSSNHSWQDIAGATGPTLSYKARHTGDRVHCLVNNATGCLKATNSVVFTVAETVAPNSTPNGYREYPNPVTGTLTIENTNPADAITTVTIYDNTGNQLFVQKYSGIRDKTTIDVSSLPKGQYYVRIRRSSGRTDHFAFLKL